MPSRVLLASLPVAFERNQTLFSRGLVWMRWPDGVRMWRNSGREVGC